MPRPPPTKGLLSPREQEVLLLVAEGLTNEEIAGRLVVSRGTATFHLTSLLQKLGADNRTQAVTHARQQGLLWPLGAHNAGGATPARRSTPSPCSSNWWSTCP
jgi:DNA-binding CsgD family transcriptional regulator